MSWKTNPIIHRIKKTYGWQMALPDAGYPKSASITNQQMLPFWRAASLWCKFHLWYLLDISKVWQSGVQIYYITAFRLPKHRVNQKRKTKLRRSVFSTEDKIRKVKKAVSYVKKITMVRYHYKHRQPLFIPVVNAVVQAQKLGKLPLPVKQLSAFHHSLLQNRIRAKWHAFILGMPDAKATSLSEFSRQLEKLKQFQRTWRFLQTAVYGTYDFKREEWSKVRTRKKLRYFLVKKSAITRCRYSQNRPQRTYAISSPRKALLKHLFVKMRLFKPGKAKVSWFSAYRRLRRTLRMLMSKDRWRFSSLRLRRKLSRKKKNKLRLRRHLFVDCYFVNTRSPAQRRLIRTMRKLKNKRLLHLFFNRNKYRRSYKYKKTQYFNFVWFRLKKMAKKKKKAKKALRLYRKFYLRHKKSQTRRTYLRKYTFWRIRYMKLRALKEKIIANFLGLITWCKKQKKTWYRLVRPSFRLHKRARGLVLKHPFTQQLRDKWYLQWQKEKSKAFSAAHARVRAGRKWKLVYPKKSRFLTFSLAWNVYHLSLVQQQKKRKFLLSTYRMNFLFKKLLRDILKINDYGTAIIRFLQPYRLLLSLRKLRQIANKNWKLARYNRKKQYKRLLPFMSILVRYWNPQPLLEQIAFELEKTKKHWVVLKIIRAVISTLKPKLYSAYRFAIIGRLSSSKRTRKFYIKSGQLPTSSVETRVAFAVCQAKARIGSFGIKSWVYITA